MDDPSTALEFTELLDQLEARETAAERMLARIGFRGFSRPRVAVSGRIFRKYRVRDPWDPDPKQAEDPIAIGPVALKLGQRRRVAPHLAPPASAKKKPKKPVDPIARFRPKKGQQARPKPKPKPESSAKAEAPTPPRSDPPSELGREFGRRNTHHPLRGPLPTRPDIDHPGANQPRAVAGPGTPEPGQPRSAGRASGGRFRMKPTAVSSPVVKTVRRLDQVTAEEAAAEASAPAPAPESIRPPMPPLSDGLDDLFGMAAMGGRMTLGRRKDAPAQGDEPDADTPSGESGG